MAARRFDTEILKFTPVTSMDQRGQHVSPAVYLHDTFCAPRMGTDLQTFEVAHKLVSFIFMQLAISRRFKTR